MAELLQLPENPASAEAHQDTLQNPWSQVEALLKPEALAQTIQEIDHTIAHDPKLALVREANEQKEGLYRRYEQTSGPDLIDQITEIDERLHTELQEDASRLYHLGVERFDATRQRVHIAPDHPLADVQLSDESPQTIIVRPGTRTENPQQALEQLQALPFVNELWLEARILPGVVNVQATSEHPLHIPSAGLIGAHNLASWAGRQTGNLKDGRPSSEVILDYASRTTPLPELEDVACYIQPDGRQLFVSTNSSHRSAAYKAQGAPVIPVKRLAFYRLKENYFTA